MIEESAMRANPTSRSAKVPGLLFLILAGLALFAVLLGVAHGFVRDFHFQWNSSRLAVIYAVKLGYPMYVPAGEGAVLNTIYGPLSYYPYFPAAFFRSPTAALAVGLALSVVFYAVPILLWLAWMLRNRDVPRISWGLALAAGFGFLTLTHPGLFYSLLKIHSDAPALCFLGTGLLSIRAFQENPRPSRLVLGGLLLACAVWSKQTLIAASFAPVFALLAQRRMKAAVIYSTAAFVSAVVLGAIFVGLHGWDTLRLNLFQIPAGHPWRMSFGAGMAELFDYPLSYAALLAWFACVVVDAFMLRRGDTDATRFLAGPSLYALVFLLMMPPGVLGFVKSGGDVNSFSPAAYAMLFILGEAVMALDGVGSRPTRWRFRIGLGLLATPLLVAAIILPVRDAAASFRANLERVPQNSAQEAFEFLERDSGRAWFPMLPLAHLAAEGRLYHFSRALQEREMAGLKMTRERIEAGAPVGFEYLIFRKETKPGDPRTYLLERLPEFEGPVPFASLKGWQVYQRSRTVESDQKPVSGQ